MTSKKLQRITLPATITINNNDELVEVYLKLGEAIKQQKINLNAINAKKVNSEWVFLMGDIYDTPAYTPVKGEIYQHVYVVKKKFWKKNGYVDDICTAEEENKGTLILPPHFHECMEACYECPKNMSIEDVKKILVQWGFTEATPKDEN